MLLPLPSKRPNERRKLTFRLDEKPGDPQFRGRTLAPTGGKNGGHVSLDAYTLLRVVPINPRVRTHRSERRDLIQAPQGLAAADAQPKTIMIDAIYLKAHPCGLKRKLGRLIGRTKGGINTKLRAVTDANGRSLSFFMTAGQVSDYTGVAALLDDLPKAQWLLGDRSYDVDWFRDALQAKGIEPCILGRNRGSNPSDTTNVATGAAAASKSCSGA